MSKPTTRAEQTAESLQSVAANLNHYAGSLCAAADLLRQAPPIPSVTVEQESNRIIGLDRLGKWVAVATQAAFNARIKASQDACIRQSDTSPKRVKK